MKNTIKTLFLFVFFISAIGNASATQKNCDQRIGTSRTLVIDTRGGPQYGVINQLPPLKLQDKEVVLTFDDGPRPGSTTRILNILRAHCVRATFFPVGFMAKSAPNLIRKMEADGHTLGSHTWSHKNLTKLSLRKAAKQIKLGVSAVQKASGKPVAPFFRFPGLNQNARLTAYLRKQNFANLSADIGTDDWRKISASEIAKRTLRRIRQNRKGIVLFHDTKFSTAAALPIILKTLKSENFKIVHLVPRTYIKP